MTYLHQRKKTASARSNCTDEQQNELRTKPTTMKLVPSSFPWCVARGCHGVGKLHKFPAKSKKKWCENLQLSCTQLTSKSRVCDAHFEEVAFANKSIRKSAIPTKHLGHDKPLLHRTPLPQLHSRQCCKCSADIKLKPFPKDERLFNLWLSLLNITEPLACRRRYVCSAHCPSLRQRSPDSADMQIIAEEDTSTNSSWLSDRSSESVPDHYSYPMVPKTYGYPHCVVRDCHGEGKLHKFPAKTKKQWCENLRINCAQLTTKSRVCDVHFGKEAFANTTIRKSAIPTNHLGHNKPPLHWTPFSKSTSRQCCKCSANRHLKPFPKEERLLNLWLSQLSITEPLVCRQKYVCYDHCPSLMFK